MGEAAERLVEAQVRRAVPDGTRVYANVPIVAKTRPTGPAHERPVVILCELPDDGDRLDQLLYTAFTRATTHLVQVVTPELARRLRTVRADVPVTARGGVA